MTRRAVKTVYTLISNRVSVLPRPLLRLGADPISRLVCAVAPAVLPAFAVIFTNVHEGALKTLVDVFRLLRAAIQTPRAVLRVGALCLTDRQKRRRVCGRSSRRRPGGARCRSWLGNAPVLLDAVRVTDGEVAAGGLTRVLEIVI
jgi:hypothetical protein